MQANSKDFFLGSGSRLLWKILSMPQFLGEIAAVSPEIRKNFTENKVKSETNTTPFFQTGILPKTFIFSKSLRWFFVFPEELS